MPPSRKFSSPLSSATPSPNLQPNLEAEETKPDPELVLDLDRPSSATAVAVEATDDARSRLSSELSEELDDDEEELDDRDGEGEGNGGGQDEDEDEDGDDGEGDEGRDDRSLTSDTVPRSPRTESDLTEEPDLPDEEIEEEAEGEDEEEEIKLEDLGEEALQGVEPEPESEIIEDQRADESNVADADADVDEDEAKTNVLPRSKRVKRIESVSMSGSPSLTPPPPSVKGKPRGLPKLSISPRVTRANGSQSQDMADVGAEGEDNGDSVDGLDGALAEDEAQDEEQDDEDDGGDGDENDEEGDVTMRPGDDLGADMEVDEADVVAPEDAPADADADAEVDVQAEAEAEGEEAEAPEPAEGEDGEQQEDEAAEEEGDVDAAETASQLTLPLRLGAHSHTSHAPPPTAAALRSLLMLEIKFAALRDRLYIERMEEAAAEEEMIHDGTHPALTYLYKTLAGRREKLHEVASRRHQQTLEELVKAREAEKDAVWTWWTDERDQLHWEEFEQTWSKRRRLAREKNEIETPRPAKPIPRPTDRLAGKGFNWAQGAVPSRLSMDDAAADLALMENRRPVHYSRHASPAVFTQQSHSGYTASAAAGPSTQTSYAAYPANQSYSKAGGSSTADHSRHTHPEAHPHAQAHAHSIAPARPPQQPSQQQQQQQPARPQQSTAQMFNQLASGGQVEHSGSAPSRSGSGGTASQVGQQGLVPRREGRTVPTSSTIFGGLMAKEPVKVESASAGGTNGLPSASASGWGTGLGLGLGGMGGMGGNKLVNGHNKEAVSGPGPVSAGASVSSSGPGPGARMGGGAGAGAHSGLGGQSNGANQPSSTAGATPSTAPTTGDKRPTPPSAAAPERRYGLADYLGGSPSGAFGSFSAGLGKVGVLSPPNVGLGARSPFSAGNSPGQQQTTTVPRS